MAELTADQWAILQRHFDALVGLSPQAQEERIAGLDLSADTERELRSLLAATAITGVLDKAAPTLTGEQAGSYRSLSAGTSIGGFIFEKLIRRGGMGEVYSARRDSRIF